MEIKVVFEDLYVDSCLPSKNMSERLNHPEENSSKGSSLSGTLASSLDEEKQKKKYTQSMTGTSNKS